MSNPNLAVIGLGNGLRRDDGIGIIALESLLHDHKQQGVDYLNFGTASFDLIHRLQDYDTVLLIDAIRAGLPPGELKIFELGAASFVKEDRAVSSHELNLKDIFELSRRFCLKTKIFVAGIQAQDISFGDSLSDCLKEKLEDTIKQINGFIRERLTECKSKV